MAADADPVGESGKPVARQEGPVEAYSINQVVAYNLMRARKASGMTQEELAQKLSECTGKKWTNASVSAAERSWQTGRVKEFDANELLTFAILFDKSVSSFLIPVPEERRYANAFLLRKVEEGEIGEINAYLRAHQEDPQAARMPFWTAEMLMSYILPTARFADALRDEANRALRPYFRSYDPYKAKLSSLSAQDAEWEEEYGATETEFLTSMIFHELNSGPDGEIQEGKLVFDPEFFRSLFEEAVSAALYQFTLGVKARSREPKDSPPVEQGGGDSATKE